MFSAPTGSVSRQVLNYKQILRCLKFLATLFAIRLALNYLGKLAQLPLFAKVDTFGATG